MHDGRIDQKHPERGKQQHKAEADPFDIGPDNQCGGDDRECHLKGKEQDFGQGARQRVRINPIQEHLAQTAPDAAGVAAKGNRIARYQPQHRHKAGDGIAVHKDAQHVARAH